MGKIVDDRTVIPEINFTFKLNLLQEKAETNLTQTLDSDQAIETFSKPIMRQPADMRKPRDSEDRLD